MLNDVRASGVPSHRVHCEGGLVPHREGGLIPDRKLAPLIEGLTLSILVTVLLLGTTSARADVDYEDQPVGPVVGTLSFPGPIFIRSVLPTEIADGGACAPNCPDNGTKYQKSPNPGVGGALQVYASADIDTCAPNCVPFDLLSIDLAEPTQSSGPVPIGITGHLQSGGTIELLFTTDGIADGPGGAPDFETYTLPPAFQDVVSVFIFATLPPNGFAVDNLVTEAPVVPTMGTWGLAALVTALAGVGWRLFRARTAGSA